MKVILTENIDKLGQKGDTKNVQDGYFRNFLWKRGLALVADSQSAKRFFKQWRQELAQKRQATVGPKKVAEPKRSKSEKRQLRRAKSIKS